MSSKRKEGAPETNGAAPKIDMETVRGLLQLFDARYKDFEKHLQTPQDKSLYQRCRKMYQAEILAVVEASMNKAAKEDADDGRHNDDAGNTDSGD